LTDEEAYKKYALEGRLHLEACPLSSVMTAAVSPQWHEHPVVRWAKDGANFSLSTDDPTCFANSIGSELVLVSEKIGLNEEQIWKCVSLFYLIFRVFIKVLN
jgi:adenosine deaminase